jgi:DNA-binding SARP family transcriptional activator/Flp pilus assembly protein TadD
VNELYQLLFEKGRVGRVLDAIKRGGLPDPATEPARSLLYAHALNQYGDYTRAQKVLADIPPDPRTDAERLWGLCGYHIRIGALHQAKRLLDRAFAADPPGWLSPHLYGQLANYYNQLGRFDDATKANQLGIAAAEMAGSMVQLLVLTGNQSIIRAVRGQPGEALTILERTVKQLLERDSALAAAHFLIVEHELYGELGMGALARRCLQRAERLVERSGSVGRMIFLKLEIGAQYGRDGDMSRELAAYREALELLRGLPDPLLEGQVNCNISLVHFRKGDFSEALSLIERLLSAAQSRGLKPQTLVCLGLRGRFLIGSGSAAAGIAVLEDALGLAERLGIRHYSVVLALHLALGWLRRGDRTRALEWLERSLDSARRDNLVSSLLGERRDLETLLAGLAGQLRFDPFLSRIALSLGHPALLKRLFRYDPPDGKLMFLRSLKVHDAPSFHSRAVRLTRDPDPGVRHAARAVIAGWNDHTAYRISALGSLRVFREDRLFPDDVWVRAGVRRLFLFLLANPGRWLSYDLILESLWREPDPAGARRVLANRLSELRRIIEPWHVAGRPYALVRSRTGSCGLFGEGRIWIDAEEFTGLARKAEDARLRRSFRESRQAYRQALDLYAGDYLEEFPYEDWLAPRRAALGALYYRSAARYAALERDSGNPAEARRVLEEALYRDLGCGECARLLVDVLLRLGLRTQARDWAARHAEHVRQTVGTGPDPEIGRLIAGLE